MENNHVKHLGLHPNQLSIFDILHPIKCNKQPSLRLVGAKGVGLMTDKEREEILRTINADIWYREQTKAEKWGWERKQMAVGSKHKATVHTPAMLIKSGTYKEFYGEALPYLVELLELRQVYVSTNEVSDSLRDSSETVLNLLHKIALEQWDTTTQP